MSITLKIICSIILLIIGVLLTPSMFIEKTNDGNVKPVYKIDWFYLILSCIFWFGSCIGIWFIKWDI